MTSDEVESFDEWKEDVTNKDKDMGDYYYEIAHRGSEKEHLTEMIMIAEKMYLDHKDNEKLKEVIKDIIVKLREWKQNTD